MYSQMFMICFVPLQLSDSDTGEIVWVNSTPNSKNYCRPVKIIIGKETPELVKFHFSDLDAQIGELGVDELRGASVTYKMECTMVDQKVINVLVGNTASTNCFLCGATPKEMNDCVDNPKPLLEGDRCQYGITPLHAYINTLECLLHISYRLTMADPKWRVPAEFKDQVSDRKKEVQDQFASRLSLDVDKPRGTTGNSNDGNTARRFFREYQISAEITGVNEDLIVRLGYILRVVNSGLPIIMSEFESYAQETAHLYVSLYSWYYMPVTVHKILVHGAQIISRFILPVGMLSEEAQETRTKDLRSGRRDHTRKCSRVASMQDLFNRLTLSSDPCLHLAVNTMPKETIINDRVLAKLIDVDYDFIEVFDDDCDDEEDLDLPDVEYDSD